MPNKAQKSAKKRQLKDQAEVYPEISEQVNEASYDLVAITAGDLTKSTASESKKMPDQKRTKKNTDEESKQPAQPKKPKRSARNRTNLNMMALAQQLDIDIGNMDPNDEELRAVLMAACAGSDDEANSPKS